MIIISVTKGGVNLDYDQPFEAWCGVCESREKHIILYNPDNFDKFYLCQSCGYRINVL